MVNYSVRAQDYLVRKSLQQPAEDASQLGSLISAPGGAGGGSLDSTVASAAVTPNEPYSHKRNKTSLLDPLGPLLLPKINAGNKLSPLKGMLDISNVTQKLKAGMAANFAATGNKPIRGHKLNGSMGHDELKRLVKKDNLFGGEDYGESKNQPVATTRGKTQSGERRKQPKMNPKVLETWINETLEDAEHLDIPGIILKSEHKTPVSRYGISRLHL